MAKERTKEIKIKDIENTKETQREGARERKNEIKEKRNNDPF
jgi:hypothetical protein